MKHRFYRNTIYSRYTPNDWGLSNQMNFSLSDKERAFGERLRADAWRAMKETDARTRNRQNDVTKKLGIVKNRRQNVLSFGDEGVIIVKPSWKPVEIQVEDRS